MTESKSVIVSDKRQRSAPYPRYSLQQVEKFARTVFNAGTRNCDQDVVAKKAGYSGAQNGSFFAMKSAANQFGFVVAKGERISVSEEWITAFLEDTPDILQRTRQEAIKQPSLYKRLFEAFSDKQLPRADKLAKTISLNAAYGITQDAAIEAVKLFIASAQYAGVLDEKGFLRTTAPVASSESGDDHDDGYEELPMFRDSGPSRGGNRPISQASVQKSTTQPPIIQSAGDGSTMSIPAGMEKQEITFRGGKKAYFILPVPLPIGEKARLKQWLDLIKLHIDLTLEDDPEPLMDDNNV